MIWQTNSAKLACATMFTLFFGSVPSHCVSLRSCYPLSSGSIFAPRFIVSQAATGARPASTQTYNIQDFLMFHFTQAMAYVAQSTHEAGLNYSTEKDGGVLGWDTFNEPDRGW
jgi:hypothetical protein